MVLLRDIFDENEYTAVGFEEFIDQMSEIPDRQLVAKVFYELLRKYFWRKYIVGLLKSPVEFEVRFFRTFSEFFSEMFFNPVSPGQEM